MLGVGFESIIHREAQENKVWDINESSYGRTKAFNDGLARANRENLIRQWPESGITMDMPEDQAEEKMTQAMRARLNKIMDDGIADARSHQRLTFSPPSQPRQGQ